MGTGEHITDIMKKITTTIIGCLLSVAVYSQVPFVSYEAVPRPNIEAAPRPNISVPKSNFNYFIFKEPAKPNISIVNSNIITTEALCVQDEGDNFTIGTKVMVSKLSNGMTTLGLIGIKQGSKWNSLDEIQLTSIPEAIAQAKTKEEKDALLNISEFSYLTVLGDNCILLFK